MKTKFDNKFPVFVKKQFFSFKTLICIFEHKYGVSKSIIKLNYSNLNLTLQEQLEFNIFIENIDNILKIPFYNLLVLKSFEIKKNVPH